MTEGVKGQAFGASKNSSLARPNPSSRVWIVDRADAVAMTEETLEHEFTSFADMALQDLIACLKRPGTLALPICKALGIEEFYSPNAGSIDAAHFNRSQLLDGLSKIPAGPEFEPDRLFLMLCLAGDKGKACGWLSRPGVKLAAAQGRAIEPVDRTKVRTGGCHLYLETNYDRDVTQVEPAVIVGQSARSVDRAGSRAAA